MIVMCWWLEALPSSAQNAGCYSGARRPHSNHGQSKQWEIMQRPDLLTRGASEAHTNGGNAEDF